MNKMERSKMKNMSLFFETYRDILAHILEFVPPAELETTATVSRGFAAGAKLYRIRIRRMEFKGRVFAENADTCVRTVPEIRPELDLDLTLPRMHSLLDCVRSATNLRRLDLIMCRMSNADFRHTLRLLSNTLRELRVEMICLFKEDALDTLRNGLRPTLVDQQHLLQGAAANLMGSTGLMMGGPMGSMLNDGAEEDAPIVMEALRRLDLSPPSSAILKNISFPTLMRLSSYRKMFEDKCSKCGAPRPSSKCGACKFYAFCKRDCQMENWQNLSFGHRKVCHISDEPDSPHAVSMLIASAARSGQLRELDLAHYWHQNVLFSATHTNGHITASAAAQAPDFEESESAEPAHRAVAVFSRPSALKVFHRLVSLRLLRCGVDDSVLRLIATHATQLRSLDVSLNTKITDAGLQNLLPLAKVLRELRLKQDYHLTDAGVRSALVHLTKLEKLDLRFGVKRLRLFPREVEQAWHHDHQNVLQHFAEQHWPNGLPNPAAAAGENGAAAPAPVDGHSRKHVRVISVTSTETLLALSAACPNLKFLRIVVMDETGIMKTEIPPSLIDKVDCDNRGCVDDDPWGEPDDFYEGWSDFAYDE